MSVKYLFAFVVVLLCLSCEEQEVQSGDLFYENFTVDRINVILDRSLYIEGAQPVSIETRAFAVRGELLNNVEWSYFLNDVEIEKPSFIPILEEINEIRVTTGNGISSTINLPAHSVEGLFQTYGYSNNFINLTSDRSVYTIGEEPIKLSATFQKDFISQRFNPEPVVFYVNDQVWPSSEFQTDQVGHYVIHVSGNGIVSNQINISVTQ